MQRIWAVMVVALVVLLTGCPVKPPPPPPPPPLPTTFSVLFTWHDDGNPGYDVCSPTVMPPCKVNYVLHDETLNADLVTLPMIDSSAAWMSPVPNYKMVLPTTSRSHQFSLYINIQAEGTGAITASPRDFAYISN